MILLPATISNDASEMQLKKFRQTEFSGTKKDQLED